MTAFAAAIFDLDGTLLDSTRVWDDIDAEFLQKRGLAVPEDYAARVAALSFEEAARYSIERFGLAETSEQLMREWNSMAAEKYAREIPLKPYAREYLEDLKRCGVRLAVATSSKRELYEPALRRNGIDSYFELFCTADDAGCGKESPAIFQLAAKRLGVPPEQCLVFEDVPQAVISAKQAGMTVFGVYDPASASFESTIRAAADGYIRDFREAPLPVR